MKNTMTVYLTDSSGNRLSELFSCRKFSSAIAKIDKWKEDPVVRRKYKIDPYNRYIYGSGIPYIDIDFGDYLTFIRIDLPEGSDSEQIIKEQIAQ